MGRFRPSVFIETDPRRNIDGVVSDVFKKSYPTYRELLKELPSLFKMAKDGTIHVYRSRRGEWGEWFEIWAGGKIIKEGWM